MKVSTEDFFLDKYKMFECMGKIVFKIPIEFMIDTSRENPELKMFKEIKVEWFYEDRDNQIVTCLKKQIT